ncbi:hypothetical protein RHSP_83103 [Rhizobium freirei PRF 81]|uniref:Uncharacterized protein n=2 Tax=Rhizobium freirei TaxID=1353277 RepID=N6UTA5_9HYPH|nr:hypothetical protein RHSP_83103 [Rhizobium freirei PRF 81]
MGWVFVVMKDSIGRPAHAAMLHFGAPIGILDLEHGERIQQLQRVSGDVLKLSQNSKVERDREAANTETTPSGGYIKRAKMLLFLIRTRHWRTLADDQTPQTKPGT